MIEQESYGRLWDCFTIEKAWARSVLADAESVRQLGTDGRWQHDTSSKEELELVRHSKDFVSKVC